MQKNIICSFLTICCALATITLNAQESKSQIVLPLSPLEDISQIKISFESIPNVLEIWEQPTDKEKLDSVLFSWIMDFNYIITQDMKIGKEKAFEYAEKLGIDSTLYQCEDLPGRLNMLVIRNKDSVTYKISKTFNSFMDEDIVLSYNLDSLKKWTYLEHPPKTFPFLSVDFPFCVNNEILREKIEFAINPYLEEFTANDKRLQDYFMTIFYNKQRIGKLNDWMLYFSKDDPEDHEDKTVILMPHDKDGKTIQDGIFDGLKYKSTYNIGDTFSLDNAGFVFEGINKEWTQAYFSEVNITAEKSKEHVSKDVYDRLESQFTNDRQFLLVDFWGTWCSPCIAKLPSLKKLYNQHRAYCNFVSVCSDEEKNMELSKSILREKGIEWEQIFDSRESGSPICKALDVYIFPSYMLINKSGEIIYKGSDDNYLSNYLESLKTINE